MRAFAYLGALGTCLGAFGISLGAPSPCLMVFGVCMGAPRVCLRAIGACLGPPSPCLGTTGVCMGPSGARLRMFGVGLGAPGPCLRPLRGSASHFRPLGLFAARFNVLGEGGGISESSWAEATSECVCAMGSR